MAENTLSSLEMLWSFIKDEIFIFNTAWCIYG